MTAPRLAPGQVVAGKYSVRAMLGYGGTTATYSAQTSAGRDVVVKMFSPQLSQRADVLGTLQQVAGVTGALGEAGVAVLETGFDPQTGAPYFATDAAPVPSLAQTVERGALGPNDVVMLLRGIATAVDAAHAQRVVHGALKPTNVFVGPPPRRSVRVGDFGVALARAALPTAEGFAVAAPWMAPEQMQGALGGPAADVFSAALVAFYAATGRSYWRSCQGAAPDLAGWQQEIGAPRVPPSARAQELGASLPAAFDGALGRALSLNPAERFASVGELAETLGKASGQPQKLAMTMPLTAMPQAAQDMLRQVAGKAPSAQPVQPAPPAPAAPPAPSPPAQPYDGGSTLAISSPVDMQWPGGQGQPTPQQPPHPQAPMQSQMQMPPPQPMAPQPMIPTPYGGFQAPAPGPASMAPQAGPSFAPPPESAVDVPKSRAALFIILALVGLVVAAGVVVLVVVMRQRAVVASLPPEATSQPAQPTAAAATAPPAASAITAPPPVETQEAGGAAAATSAAALAAAGVDADAGPEEAELTIVCMPDCDSVKIDDAPLDTNDAGVVPQEPLRLAAGPHTLAAGRATFVAQTRKVTLKPGQKSKETFFLSRPGAVVAPPKPCGKFLERCPN